MRVPSERVAKASSLSVAHMRCFRFDENGQRRDLWHIWDMLGMLRQLGALPVLQREEPHTGATCERTRKWGALRYTPSPVWIASGFEVDVLHLGVELDAIHA
jgi:hypothetical protein